MTAVMQLNAYCVENQYRQVLARYKGIYFLFGATHILHS